jgi:hypothetical protein
MDAVTDTRYWKMPDGTYTSTSEQWAPADPEHPEAVERDDGTHEVRVLRQEPPDGAVEVDRKEHDAAPDPHDVFMANANKIADEGSAARAKAVAAIQKKLGLTDDEMALLSNP